MKKLILVAMMAIFSLSVSAQVSNYTPKFMGIEIKGTIQQFEKNLKQKGFTKGDNGFFEGEFLGKNVKLVVSETAKTKQVYQVVVLYGREATYKSYMIEIRELNDLFSNKYGKSEEVKTFFSPYKEGDGYEMTALRIEKLDWSLNWGKELIIIVNGDFGILIYYTNSKLNELNDKEQKQINLSEI